MEINKEIIGKAYLEYASSQGHFALSETYIPLLCQCINKRCLQSVDSSIIKHALDEDYGLHNITIGAVDAFLKRMKKLGYFNRKDNAFIPLEKVSICKDDIFKHEFLANYDELLIQITIYIKQQSGLDYSKEQIDDFICNFLNKYDLDLFYNELSKIERLATQDKNEKKFTYLFSKYVLDAFQNHPEQALFLRRLSKGHILSSIVSLENLSDYWSKLNKVTIYLDAPLMYGLLGFSNPVNKELIDEMLTILQNSGARFAIFVHNYNEVLSTLEDAKDRLLRSDYDFRISSRVLRYAVREHKSADFIQTKISQIDGLLERWNIDILDRPDLPKNYTDIDEKRLTSIVENLYKKAKQKYLLKYQETLIDTDVMSVSSIFRLRGNIIVHQLNNCVALLVTTNVPICKAAKDKSITNIHHIIPVAITDVDLSALLWTNNPQQNEDLDKRMLMAECLDNIKLDDNLLYKFRNEAKRRLDEGTITKETYSVLMSSHLTNQLIADKTFNDSDAYTDATLNEIAEAFMAEKDQRIIELENSNDLLKGEIEQGANKEVIRKDAIITRVNTIADKISAILMWILFIVLLVCSLLSEIVSHWSSILGHVLGGIWILWSLYSILIKTVCPSLPPIKSILSKWIAKGIFKVLKALSDKIL